MSRSAPTGRRSYHHGDLKNALVQAGTEILAADGPAGLTLRRAAQRAGVSHSAPYAHFADKQALVAAISTEALRRLRARLETALRRSPGDPLRQLQETAWETVRFGLAQPDQYRMAFSVAVEREADHPEYREMAHGTFDLLVGLVEGCQRAGVLPAGPPDRAAVELWGLVHGLVSLLIHRQVPQRVLARTPVRRLVLGALSTHLGTPPPAAAPRRAGRRPAR